MTKKEVIKAFMDLLEDYDIDEDMEQAFIELAQKAEVKLLNKRY